MRHIPDACKGVLGNVTLSDNNHGALRFLQAGDCHLVVEFGRTIDRAINHRVISAASALRRLALHGVTEVLPTYRSLLVRYDPELTDSDCVAAAVRAVVEATPEAQAAAARTWRVPVVYGGEFGPDLEAVAARHSLTSADVIELHASAIYTVFMIGFAPGYAYLGGLSERLHTPRRGTLRMLTPPGSVSIGGVQAGIASIALPSGWNILGRTPLRTFDLAREPACLFTAGTLIRFMPIPAEQFDDDWCLAPEPNPE